MHLDPISRRTDIFLPAALGETLTIIPVQRGKGVGSPRGHIASVFHRV
jgi:hypothetical protein